MEQMLSKASGTALDSSELVINSEAHPCHLDTQFMICDLLALPVIILINACLCIITILEVAEAEACKWIRMEGLN